MSKLKVDAFPLTSPKVPILEFNENSKSWLVKTSYPNENSVAGVYTVLGVDGSVSEMTLDEAGAIVKEIKVK